MILSSCSSNSIISQTPVLKWKRLHLLHWRGKEVIPQWRKSSTQFGYTCSPPVFATYSNGGSTGKRNEQEKRTVGRPSFFLASTERHLLRFRKFIIPRTTEKGQAMCCPFPVSKEEIFIVLSRHHYTTCTPAYASPPLSGSSSVEVMISTSGTQQK